MTVVSGAATIVLAASLAAPVAQQPFNPPARRESAMSALQGFNIVLLVGESQSSGESMEDVPPAARRALSDMKDFLPFKHYRVLDSQWTSCCADITQSRIFGRVLGVAGLGQAQTTGGMRLVPRTYGFFLNVSAGATRLNVHFSLNPEAGAVRTASARTLSAAREEELERRLFDLRKQLDALEDDIQQRRRGVGEKHPDIQSLAAQRSRVQQRIAETTRELTAGRAGQGSSERTHALIDSNFTMDIGETVVVGTSRLGGDKALIAIVTAVKKGGSR